MTVATFLQTNYTSDTSTVWKGAIDGNFAVLSRLGTMFAPNQQTVANMTVQLQAGHVFNGTTLTEVAAQNSAVIVAPVTNPRIDRIVIDKTTGVVSVVTGTPAASPVAPAIPSTACPVARVALTSSTTSITNSLITDERDFTGLGGQSTLDPYGVTGGTTTAYTVTTTPAFSALSAGVMFRAKINAANTATAFTINPNGIGATSVKNNIGLDPGVGAALTNSIYEFLYDGTNLIMLNNTTPYRYLPYAADLGAANAYSVTPVPAIASTIPSGTTAILKPANANTGVAATLAVAGSSARSIKMMDGTDPYANALLTTGMYTLPFDGTNWVLTNPSPRVFVGDSGSGGQPGLVPAPAAGDAAAGKVLGAGGTFVTPPAGSTLLSVKTAAASASFDFTSVITSAYDAYFWIFLDIRMSANSDLFFRTSTNNGSTWSNSSSNYQGQALVIAGGAFAPPFSTAAYLGIGITNTAADALSGTMTLFNPLGTTANKNFFFQTVYNQGSNAYIGLNTRLSTAAINAVQFRPNSGTFTSGYALLYGYQK